jgi:carbon monoxide dehydrogenase subunit G
MDLSHRFTVPARLDEAWQTFNDMEGLAPCLPGATISSVEGDEFAGSVKVKLGPIALLYSGTGRYAERDDAEHRVVIQARGKDKRGNGTASATVTASFAEQGEQTEVDVQTDLTITGKPAQFGRGVISEVSDKLLEQFVTCVSGRFAADQAAAAVPEQEEQPTAPPSESAVSDQATPEQPVQERVAMPGRRTETPEAAPAEINLLSSVGPVLLKRYGPIAAAVGLVLLLVITIIRRRS